MERIFTKNVGRFVKGQLRDYPKQVWEQLAKSAKMKIEDFTKVAVMLETQDAVKPNVAA